MRHDRRPLTLRVGRGEHWAILGPNCAQDTLLSGQAPAPPRRGPRMGAGRTARRPTWEARAHRHVGHHSTTPSPRMRVLASFFAHRARIHSSHGVRGLRSDDVAERVAVARVRAACHGSCDLSQGERHGAVGERCRPPRLLLFDDPLPDSTSRRETLLEAMLGRRHADAPTTLSRPITGGATDGPTRRRAAPRELVVAGPGAEIPPTTCSATPSTCRSPSPGGGSLERPSSRGRLSRPARTPHQASGSTNRP